MNRKKDLFNIYIDLRYLFINKLKVTMTWTYSSDYNIAQVIKAGLRKLLRKEI